MECPSISIHIDIELYAVVEISDFQPRAEITIINSTMTEFPVVGLQASPRIEVRSIVGVSSSPNSQSWQCYYRAQRVDF